jgi:hypothetical protein
MMKILLGFASLSFLWVCCTPINAQAKRLEPTVGKLPKDVVGVGESEEKAKATAYLLAARVINELMAIQKPPMDKFVVTEEFARNHLVDLGVGGEGEKDGIFGKQPKTWTLKFRTDTDWWTDLVHRDQTAQRKARADERHTWAARVMIGLAVLLCASFGYVRLDDYTQRRYTTWLRLAGLGVATSVAAGWWYVFQGN